MPWEGEDDAEAGGPAAVHHHVDRGARRRGGKVTRVRGGGERPVPGPRGHVRAMGQLAKGGGVFRCHVWVWGKKLGAKRRKFGGESWVWRWRGDDDTGVRTIAPKNGRGENFHKKS